MNGTYNSRILPPVLKQLQGGSVLLSCGLGQEVLLSLEFHSQSKPLTNSCYSQIK